MILPEQALGLRDRVVPPPVDSEVVLLGRSHGVHRSLKAGARRAAALRSGGQLMWMKVTVPLTWTFRWSLRKFTCTAELPRSTRM